MALTSKRKRTEFIEPDDVQGMVLGSDGEAEGMSSDEDSDLDHQLGYESDESDESR